MRAWELAKDTIKDALMSIIPVPDVAASRQLGRASTAVMLALAAASTRSPPRSARVAWDASTAHGTRSWGGAWRSK